MSIQSMKVLLAGVLAMVATSAVQADTINVTASNNGTIKPLGPRTGTNGKSFFNIEGVNNTTNASFGVADFPFTSSDGTVGLVDSISVKLTEANAAFTMPGTLDFYLSDNTAASIDPGTSSLKYKTSVTPPGVDSQLDNLYLLGTGDFKTTGNVNNGQVDTFSFTPNASAAAYVKGVLNAGGALRLVISEECRLARRGRYLCGIHEHNLSRQPHPFC